MMLGSTSIFRIAFLNYKFKSDVFHSISSSGRFYNLLATPHNVQRNNSIRVSPRPLVRHSSYSANESSSNKRTTNTINSDVNLDWNTFFQLRKKRRWYQQTFSVGASIGGVIGATQILMHSDLEMLLSVSQISLDPFITLGLMTFTCGGLGWLLGPVAGTALFNWKNHKLKAQIDEREKEFFRRVRRHRVDPSNSSMANPVPDYYGEKVSSVQDYRQWLKDCRAFNKKRTTYLK